MAIRQFEDKQPDIHSSVFIDETALVVGDVQIGKNSSVWPLTVVRGDVNSIVIGENTNIQDNSVLHVSHAGPYNPGGFDLKIGDNVTVGHRVILHGCQIKDSCLIGMGSTIMDGVIIEPHTIIGAGSLVTENKHLESGYLWMGSPARQVRKLRNEEIESIEYSAQHYVRLKNSHHR
ncbi:MAG: gamma carbonic anhydrase family protein [Gammaproteobacteria bacterium]|nr:gamma carbonic anhydrase family protein [Gammaproteobacteria bacterium]